ncbi:MAG TPA: OmpH family outer membrane protein [Terriglobales bacterium]|jgi:hypothetical protein|nr:OmpH family outer membrane protein [Terriglobales bacterium]
MRGQYAIATLLLLVLGLAPAAWAQHRGGPTGAPMGPAMVPGPRAAMGNPGVPTVRGFHPGGHPGFRPGFNHGFRHDFDHDRDGRFHNRRFTNFVPWGGYYYSPYVDYDAQAQAEYESQQAAARALQEQTEDQIRQQALQRTIDDLKDYNERRDRELEQERLQRESAPQPPAPPDPAIILVFKDGHRAQVYNYAIMGDTFYDLSGGRSHKIPLADLDVDATTKVNDQNGVDFRLPGSRNPA